MVAVYHRFRPLRAIAPCLPLRRREGGSRILHSNTGFLRPAEIRVQQYP
jgi:hypothetical protein